MKSRRLFTVMVIFVIFNSTLSLNFNIHLEGTHQYDSLEDLKCCATQDTITYADKDSYVDNVQQIENYGKENYTKIQLTDVYFIVKQESYFHFNFANRPSNWSKAMFKFTVSHASASMKLTASIVAGTWSEDQIIWANKPDHDKVITTSKQINAGKDSDYIIDVTQALEGIDSDVTICLNATAGEDDSEVSIYSREGATNLKGDLDYAPRIVWTEVIPDPVEEEEQDDTGDDGSDGGNTTNETSNQANDNEDDNGLLNHLESIDPLMAVLIVGLIIGASLAAGILVSKIQSRSRQRHRGVMKSRSQEDDSQLDEGSRSKNGEILKEYCIRCGKPITGAPVICALCEEVFCSDLCLAAHQEFKHKDELK